MDVWAPGADVTTLAVRGSGQRKVTGTEYAAAFVAGLAALVRSALPDLGAAQVVDRIRATAVPVQAPVPDPAYGWGFIDPGGAVTAALADEGGSDKASSRRTAEPPGPGLRLWLIAAAVGCATALAVVLMTRRRPRRSVTRAIGR